MFNKQTSVMNDMGLDEGEHKAQSTCVEVGDIFICYTRRPCTVGAGSSI